MEKDRNLIDLIVDCWEGLKRLLGKLGCLLASMLRLSARCWWVVLPVVLLFLGAAFYYSRPANKTHKVNAIVRLNGPSIEMLRQVYKPLEQMPDTKAPIATETLLGLGGDVARRVHTFKTFEVIDCLNDSTADYVDYKHKRKQQDTLNVVMPDRLALQFRVRGSQECIPEVEEQLLRYLNADPQLQRAYDTYMVTLDREVEFCHTQIEKLDSLTSSFYFLNQDMAVSITRWSTGLVVGDRRIRLFLDDIYRHIAYTRFIDERKAIATAPVVIENHFVMDARPINGRLKCLIIGLLAGWIIGCILAALVDQRKAISAWLRQ
ncbi:MAG: hypothetical protein IJ581_02645 [Paludibacteraceae bacterium]|nr:hypothetical protein [Paludibacteraceae bacterium]